MLIIIINHRKNIKRLFTGVESKITKKELKANNITK
jgi:hypothetical protein